MSFQGCTTGGQLKWEEWKVGHGFGVPMRIGAFFNSFIVPEENAHVDIVDSTPPITPLAFNGRFRLFVDGKEEGVLFIRYPEATFSQEVEGSVYLGIYPLRPVIREHHIVLEFPAVTSLYVGDSLNLNEVKLDGYLSGLDANSIAGIAWRKDKPVGFYAVRLSVEQPNK